MAITVKSQKERFRQRFMHKLVYFPANNDGMYSCVDAEDAWRNVRNPKYRKVIKAFAKQGGEK